MNNFTKFLDKRYSAWKKYIGQAYSPHIYKYDYNSLFTTCGNCGKTCVNLYDIPSENMCYECLEEDRIAFALDEQFFKEKRKEKNKEIGIDPDSRLQQEIENTKDATKTCCVCGKKCNCRLQNLYGNGYRSIFPRKNRDLDHELCRNLICHIRLYRISTIKPYRNITAKFLIEHHIQYNQYNQRELAVALGELIYYIQLKTKRRKKWKK